MLAENECVPLRMDRFFTVTQDKSSIVLRL